MSFSFRHHGKTSVEKGGTMDWQGLCTREAARQDTRGDALAEGSCLSASGMGKIANWVSGGSR